MNKNTFKAYDTEAARAYAKMLQKLKKMRRIENEKLTKAAEEYGATVKMLAQKATKNTELTAAELAEALAAEMGEEAPSKEQIAMFGRWADIKRKQYSCVEASFPTLQCKSKDIYVARLDDNMEIIKSTIHRAGTETVYRMG